jgi:hypothetical protein
VERRRQRQMCIRDRFQATKQSINLGILKVLEKEKVVMARS